VSVTFAVNETACPRIDIDGLLGEVRVVCVVAALTVRDVVLELLWKFESPPYVPVTVVPPGALALGVNVQVPVPFEAFVKVITHESPAVLPRPSETVTVPVGAPAYCGATVAVAVVLSPKLIFVGLTLTTVEVVAWVTMTVPVA
jgi:hypothetical protein